MSYIATYATTLGNHPRINDTEGKTRVHAFFFVLCSLPPKLVDTFLADIKVLLEVDGWRWCSASWDGEALVIFIIIFFIIWFLGIIHCLFFFGFTIRNMKAFIYFCRVFQFCFIRHIPLLFLFLFRRPLLRGAGTYCNSVGRGGSFHLINYQ